jgi:hypothetical protein
MSRVIARRKVVRGTKARRESATVKTFSLHWGSGIIEEEVQIVTPYHVPTIQLLKFTAGPTAGRRAVRFCHYDTRGRFQRSPLIIDEQDVEVLAKALTKAAKLRKMLAAFS